MHTEALPDATAKLLDDVSRIDEFAQFTLIGGTALALQVAHRESEDLDFVVHDSELDSRLILNLVSRLAGSTTPQLITSAANRNDFELAGLDIDKSHQDWLVRGVKVTFFAPGDTAEARIYKEVGCHDHGSVRVLDKEGVFRLKSNVILDRTTSRDVFDLWWFVTHDGKSIEDITDRMGYRKRHLSIDMQLAKICPSKFREADPGFSPLLSNAPVDKDDLLGRMRKLIGEERSRLAQIAVQGLSKGPAAQSGPSFKSLPPNRGQGR